MIRLGSASATRAKLLMQNGIEFVQSPSQFDEDTIMQSDPIKFVYEATHKKFEELYLRYGIESMPLLVADTVVSSKDILLRKPKDIDDAKRMLALQSGAQTTIITCMIYKSKEVDFFDISKTSYHFYPFEAQDIDAYIQSGKCMGKAGAIMVEEFCKPYIKKVTGYESTAMGLCVEKLLQYI